MNVLVLGCGPAGLFAAHAATVLGHKVQIMSKKRRSEMFGAQYLHTEIPGLTDDQQGFQIEYRLEGELDAYLHKVYGEEIPDRSNITKESLVGIYPAWDIRRAYHAAWNRYAPSIANVLVGPAGVGFLLRDFKHDLIISTVPAPDLCLKPSSHEFVVRPIWAIGDAPERGTFAPDFVAEENVILYDGSEEESWYRASRIAGYNAVEWPIKRPPILAPASKVEKPIKTNCDCWVGDRFIRLGRYGSWHRSGHTHQAYWRTLEVLEGR